MTPKKPLGGFNLPPEKKRRTVEGGAVLVKAPRSSPLRRSAGGERLVVYLPPDLALEFRVKCAEQRRSHSDAMTEAVDDFLSKRPPKKGAKV